jgi:peptide/nickel transport system substrate-binding protein
MKKFLFLVLLVAMVAAAVVPAFAQESGTGGIIIEGNFGGDPAHFNPILAGDTASRRISAFLYPGFINANVETANYSPYEPPLAAGGIVESWTIDDTGTVYTFKLREGLTWNDGDPIDSADVIYTWNAIKAGSEGLVDTALSFVIDPTGASGILDVVAVDDYTVQVTFAVAECTALGNVGVLYPVPSHVLPADVSQLNDTPEDLNPTVTQGVFNFAYLNPSEAVGLVANPAYFDAQGGVVNPEGFIYKVVPDQTVLVEQFLAGETNVIDGPAIARRADIRAAADAGTAQVFPFPGNAWDYFAMNLADPSNPQNGLDADGNPIDQGNHPIFGDVRVRQAISQGINVEDIISAAVLGEGERMTSFIIPASWAYNTELPPIAYDVEAAAALLDEAGWVDDDGNVDTPRVAQGAMYAEDGTPLQFTLYTNEGNGRREAIGTLIQDQLSELGIQVDFQTIDFNTLLDIMDSQTFDSFILGWRNGWPDDPDATQLFTAASDVVGSGSNNTSWNNEEFTALNLQAKTLPGCDPAERAALYGQMQEIFQQDLPYVPLFAINGFYAAGGGVEGFGPYPSNLFWNVDSWNVVQQ